MKQSFRPEFLNRLDEIILFKPLTAENMTDIVEILLNRLIKRLESENLHLTVTPAAKKFIAENGSDSIYGARPLKRYLQTRAETPIAKFIVGPPPQARALRSAATGTDWLLKVNGKDIHP